MRNKYIARSISDLPAIAKKLINAFPENRIFGFYGKMGVGKTTFVKAVAKTLNVSDIVNSPTFAIINEYIADNGESIYHFDLYRINKAEELLDIGYEDYFFSGDYCLIEWPEKIPELLPLELIEVFIEEDQNSGYRIFSF